jgi:hypothetical protein
MDKNVLKFFGFVFLVLGLLVLALRALDPIPHLSLPGLVIIVLGLASFASSFIKK